jgi:hypothetical protein
MRQFNLKQRRETRGEMSFDPRSRAGANRQSRMVYEKSPKLPASGLNDHLAVLEPSLAAGLFWRARNREGPRVAGEAERASAGRRKNPEAVPARRREGAEGSAPEYRAAATTAASRSEPSLGTASSNRRPAVPTQASASGRSKAPRWCEEAGPMDKEVRAIRARAGVAGHRQVKCYWARKFAGVYAAKPRFFPPEIRADKSRHSHCLQERPEPFGDRDNGPRAA